MDKINKRILFLSPFFYPEMISTGKYNSYLVKALVNRGYLVDVVASHPLYPDWKPVESRAGMKGCAIHRGGLRVRYPKSIVLRRLFLELWYIWHSATRARKIGKTVDIMIAVFPPNLYMFIMKRFLPANIQTVGIVHDLQGIMAQTHKTVSRRIIAGIMRYFEIRVLDSCDELICMSEKMREAMVAIYGISQDKCKVHYPFITENTTLENTSELAGIMPDGFNHIVYSGALGEKQKPEFIFRFFKQLCLTRDDVMCHIFSRGPIFEEIKNKLNSDPVERIRLHDLVPKDMLGELYQRSSVQIIPQAEGTGAGAFPSKLPNLIKAGVPVFAICDLDSELASVMNETGIGKVVHKWNIDLCVRKINLFLDSIHGDSHYDRYRKVEAYIARKFNVEHVVDTIVGGNIK
jgi:hypothetical protein